MPRQLLPAVLTMIVVLCGPAGAQTSLQSPSYGGGILLNPSSLYGGATVMTPGALLHAAPTGSFPTSAPCDPSQAMSPLAFPGPSASTPGTFKPPITPSYRGFTDRFARPPQPDATDADTGGCR